MELPGSDRNWNFLVEINRGGRVTIFLVSLVLASAVWLLNALNKTYVESVEIGLKYINLPKNFAYNPIPPSKLKLEISSDGYNLFQVIRQSRKDTLELDLQLLEFSEQGGRSRSVISTDILLSSIRGEFGNGVNISHLGMDSIPIILEMGKTVDLPVEAHLEITPEKGFTLVRPVFSNPETVKVSGPKSIIDTLSRISTESIQVVNANKSIEREVKLIVESRALKVSPEKVRVLGELERLTEGEIEIPIQVVGLPEGRRVRLIPETVRVKYSVGLSKFERVQPEFFKAAVHYSDVLEKPSRLTVTVESIPTFVNVIQLHPERVDYFLLEKLD